MSLAAVKLQITQAAASRQLAAIETRFDGRVFFRTGRGLKPTELGERVLAGAAEILERLERLETDARSASRTPVGEVHLGVLPSISRKLVPHLFHVQRKHWPDVILRIHEGFSGALDESLKAGDLDLAVLNRYGPSPAETEFFLDHVELVLVAVNGDRVTAGNEVAFKSLAGLPLILPAAPNALRVLIDQHARAQHLLICEALSADSLPLLIDLAVQERCYTIVPETYVSQRVAAGEFQASRIVAPSMRRAVSLALSSRRPSTVACMEVARTVREFFQRAG